MTVNVRGMAVTLVRIGVTAGRSTVARVDTWVGTRLVNGDTEVFSVGPDIFCRTESSIV